MHWHGECLPLECTASASRDVCPVFVPHTKDATFSAHFLSPHDARRTSHTQSYVAILSSIVPRDPAHHSPHIQEARGAVSPGIPGSRTVNVGTARKKGAGWNGLGGKRRAGERLSTSHRVPQGELALNSRRCGVPHRTDTVAGEAVYAVRSCSTVVLRQYELPRSHWRCACVECAQRIGVCETLYFDPEASMSLLLQTLKASRRSMHDVPTCSMSP
ncbi:hypothetical protein BV25DRAFT_1037883 [Artomyces pyxidatus]|uniref:Uncharacterized protein n=1 Tax=Artomyces pyxidatus TaxID=48021 RepID=A0ACB8SW11_9AGAM|nr:hypothetical protein BV25DRAFT_1037883 [Artomyces pyxidatus]